MLRLRTIVFLCLAVGVMVSGLYVLADRVFMKVFFELERIDAERNTDRAVSAMRELIENLDTVARDWAEYDETYQYMADHNAGYVTANLVPESFENISVHLFMLFDEKGKLVIARRVDGAFQKALPLPRGFLRQHAQPHSPLLLQNRLYPQKGLRGLVNTSEGTLLLAARQVLRSNESGPPRGTLVMGRFLEFSTLQRLEEIIELSITVEPLKARTAAENPFFTQPVAVWSEEYVWGNRVMTDIYDQPALRVSVSLPRHVVRLARNMVREISLILLAGGVLMALLLYALMEGLVLRRILRLHRRVNEIGRTRDLSLRVPAGGRDELAGLAAQINAMLHALQNAQTELKHANQELASFSYTLSHDLRAPVRHIKGFTDALEEDFGPDLKPEARDHLARVRRAATRMGEIIENMLLLFRIGRAELNMERVDLTALVQEVWAELAASITAGPPQLVVEPGMTAHGDRGLLRALFENLLGNALKFSALEPRPVVRVGQESVDGQRVFVVRDNGVGFDMERAGELFQPFRRLDNAQGFEGTGVGLACVKRVVQRHGGEVWAQARPGEGAAFFFTLPLG